MIELGGVWSFDIELVEIGQVGAQHTTVRSCRGDSTNILLMVGGEEVIASFMPVHIKL